MNSNELAPTAINVSRKIDRIPQNLNVLEGPRQMTRIKSLNGINDSDPSNFFFSNTSSNNIMKISARKNLARKIKNFRSESVILNQTLDFGYLLLFFQYIQIIRYSIYFSKKTFKKIDKVSYIECTRKTAINDQNLNFDPRLIVQI